MVLREIIFVASEREMANGSMLVDICEKRDRSKQMIYVNDGPQHEMVKVRNVRDETEWPMAKWPSWIYEDNVR